MSVIRYLVLRVLVGDAEWVTLVRRNLMRGPHRAGKGTDAS
jgi:hypothetical protein